MRLPGLAGLFSSALQLFGQQRQQVDGDVVLTLLLLQAVHHPSRERKGAEGGNSQSEERPACYRGFTPLTPLTLVPNPPQSHPGSRVRRSGRSCPVVSTKMRGEELGIICEEKEKRLNTHLNLRVQLAAHDQVG